MLTSTSVGSGSDVFTSLPEALGLSVGMIVQDPNTGNFRQLVQHDPAAAGVLPIGAAVKFLNGSYVVLASVAVDDYVEGANDRSGVTIPIGAFFWMSCIGQFRPLVAAGVAAGVIVAATAVAGELDLALVADTASVRQANIRTLAASGAGGATLCQLG